MSHEAEAPQLSQPERSDHDEPIPDGFEPRELDEHIFPVDISDAVRIQYHPQRFIEGWDPDTMSLTVTTPNRLSRGIAWLLGKQPRAHGHLTTNIPPEDDKIARGSVHNLS